MTPTWRIHRATHTHNITNLHDTNPRERPRRNPDTRCNESLRASVPATCQKKRTRRWRSTGTRPKIIRESCKTFWHLTQKTRIPWNKEQTWDMPSSPSGYAGSWFVLGFVSLLCVGPCFCVRCSVFHACCSFCVFMFWCLVMLSPVGMWSLISHCDQCVFGSMSYLVFSDKISSGVVIVCLSGILSYF